MTADMLELEESGQYRLGVDGEQRSLEGFAAPVEPAPLNHTPERTAAELREERQAVELEEPRTIEQAIELEEPRTIDVDEGAEGELAAEELGEIEPEEPEEPATTTARSSRSSAREYRCAYCRRRLKPERWVFSRHTGSRFCTPGEGCNTPTAYRRQELERDRARRAREEG